MRGFFKLEENLKSRLRCANSDLSYVNTPNFIKELQNAENSSSNLDQSRLEVDAVVSTVHQRGFVCFKGCTVVNNDGTY